MQGKIIDFSLGMNRKQRITLELSGDFRESYEELKESVIDVIIKKFREKRSLTSNAYFHVLVEKIAEKEGLGNEEVKKSLVLEYGALAKDVEGYTVGFKLPSSVNIDTIYEYAKVFDTREENGRMFNCYLVYKRTRDLDSKEFCRLIDGAIYVAQQLGIETDTPEQLAKYKESWK